jgi:hypothetical protein
MPVEPALLPLTPRVETTTGTYYANVLDDKATLAMSQVQGGFGATATGVLRSVAGAASPTTFRWSYEFGPSSYTKELTVSSAANLRIVEPFVDNAGSSYEVTAADTFQITTADGHAWQLKVVSSTGAYQLVAGENRAAYWSPFPGIDAYPLAINLSGMGSYTIKYTVSQVK